MEKTTKQLLLIEIIIFLRRSRTNDAEAHKDIHYRYFLFFALRVALKAALNGVRAKFGTGGIRAGVKRADKVISQY